MEEVFTNVYINNSWGNDNNDVYNGSSGEGSEINFNMFYYPFILCR